MREAVTVACVSCGDECVATSDDEQPRCSGCSQLLEVRNILRGLEDGSIDPEVLDAFIGEFQRGEHEEEK